MVDTKYFNLGWLEFTATVYRGRARVECLSNASVCHLEYIEGDGWLSVEEDPHFPGVPWEVYIWVVRGD
jgi:hypothetical protein